MAKKSSLVLPKKMKKADALELYKEPAPKRVSKLKTKGMRSIIGDSADDIQQMLEKGNNDSANSLIQKRMMQALIDVLPYAEHSIRKSKGARGVYQLNSLITSVREIMIDLQSTKDRGALGSSMVEKIIRPAFLDIGMMIVTENERLVSSIKDELEDDVEAYKKIRKLQRDFVATIANTINGKYNEAKEKAVEFLQT